MKKCFLYALIILNCLSKIQAMDTNSNPKNNTQKNQETTEQTDSSWLSTLGKGLLAGGSLFLAKKTYDKFQEREEIFAKIENLSQQEKQTSGTISKLLSAGVVVSMGALAYTTPEILTIPSKDEAQSESTHNENSNATSSTSSQDEQEKQSSQYNWKKMITDVANTIADIQNPSQAKRPINKINSINSNGFEVPSIMLNDMSEVPRQLLIIKKLIERGRSPKGVLLHGPPGTGKTVFVKALAGSLGFKIKTVSGSSFASKWMGEGPKNVKALFNTARTEALKGGNPVFLFIDEVDSAIPSRNNSTSNGNNGYTDIVNQWLCELSAENNDGIIVFMATNHLKNLDEAATRSGRVDYKIEIGLPGKNRRTAIFRSELTKLQNLDPAVNIEDLSTSFRAYPKIN